MKKWIALLLCLLMVLGLTACGAEEEVVEETVEEVVEQTTEETADKPYAGQVLEVWTGSTEGTEEYEKYLELVEEFEEMTGATVNVSAWGTELKTLLGTALGAGEDIDVFTLGSQQQLEANLEYTLDLTEYIENSDILDRAYPVYMDIIAETSGDGTYHATPSLSSITSFWYNKAIFDEVGITENPTTIEEFEAVCDKLVAAGYQPIALDSAYCANYFGSHVERYVGEENAANMILNGGFAESEDFIAACDKIIEWVNKGYFDENAPCEFPASQNKIGLTGEVVMVFTGIWAPGEVEDMTGTDLEWGSFKYPALPGGPGTYGAPLSCSCVCINANTDTPDLAWEYLYFFGTGKADKVMADLNVYVPDDRTNEPLDTFADTMEILSTTENVINYAGGMHANADAKTSVNDVIIQLYGGSFKTGLEAAKAFDALVK